MSRPLPEPTAQQLLEALATQQQQGEQLRAGLARLLHDELGALLAAARLELSRLRQGQPQAVAAALGAVERQLVQALEIKRQSVEVLRPGLLDHFGLLVALRSRFEQRCGAEGVPLRCQLPPGSAPLAPAHAVALYRLAEAVLESALGAGAGALALSGEVAGGILQLQIAREGIAAELERSPLALGLILGLRWLGGSYAQGPGPGGGSQWLLAAPLAPPPS